MIVLPVAVITLAVAPDVPPVITSPTVKLPATAADNVKDEPVTLCFKYTFSI